MHLGENRRWVPLVNLKDKEIMSILIAKTFKNKNEKLKTIGCKRVES